MNWKQAQEAIETKKKADAKAESEKATPLVLKEGEGALVRVIEGEEPVFEPDKNGDLCLKSLRVKCLDINTLSYKDYTIELGPEETAKLVKLVNAGNTEFHLFNLEGKVKVCDLTAVTKVVKSAIRDFRRWSEDLPLSPWIGRRNFFW